jgi:hypothetical protein
MKSRFRIALSDLVQPDSRAFGAHSLEKAFQIFRWMVKTGDAYREENAWSPSTGVRELLSASSAVGLRHVTEIASVADLKKRFAYAILKYPHHQSVVKWRNDHGIEFGGTVTIPYAVTTDPQEREALGFGFRQDIDMVTNDLLGGHKNHRMAFHLNGYHHDCRHVHSVKVHVAASGFLFRLNYGEDMVDNRIGSEWSYDLAATREGETFAATLARARDNFAGLVYGERWNKLDLADSDDTLANIALARQFEALENAHASTPSPM